MYSYLVMQQDIQTLPTAYTPAIPYRTPQVPNSTVTGPSTNRYARVDHLLSYTYRFLTQPCAGGSHHRQSLPQNWGLVCSTLAYRRLHQVRRCALVFSTEARWWISPHMCTVSALQTECFVERSNDHYSTQSGHSQIFPRCGGHATFWATPAH
jgi:hypothetical protein